MQTKNRSIEALEHYPDSKLSGAYRGDSCSHGLKYELLITNKCRFRQERLKGLSN